MTFCWSEKITGVHIWFNVNKQIVYTLCIDNSFQVIICFILFFIFQFGLCHLWKLSSFIQSLSAKHCYCSLFHVSSPWPLMLPPHRKGIICAGTTRSWVKHHQSEAPDICVANLHCERVCCLEGLSLCLLADVSLCVSALDFQGLNFQTACCCFFPSWHEAEKKQTEKHLFGRELVIEQCRRIETRSPNSSTVQTEAFIKAHNIM